jgi:serine/threonine-protein kinase PknG
VLDRYDICGAIDRGGLGWVYLAFDLKIKKHVALKGLRDSEDPRHRRVAEDELRALAATQHKNIVAVLDTVRHTHRQPATGQPAEIDYIVMDYVRGRSFRDLRAAQPLRIVEAGEAILEALDALGHLHTMQPHGLLYNDFSPSNLMRGESGWIWLIDLGAVSILGEPGRTQTWGTPGYRDPYGNPPSPQTDMYAVARTLARLTLAMPNFTDGRSLPDPGDEPRLRSFHLLLQRATDPDPTRRFESAAEMAEQLEGVLCEARAATDGTQHPRLSSVFGQETVTFGANTDRFPQPPGDRPAWARALPDTLVDRSDRYANQVAPASTSGPAQLLKTIESRLEPTFEMRLRVARARLDALAAEDWDRTVERLTPALRFDRTDLDDLTSTLATARRAFTEAGKAVPPVPGAAAALQVCETYSQVSDELAKLAEERGQDLRIAWQQSIALLLIGAVTLARDGFTGVRQALPGEIAPRLALGTCAELLGDHRAAREQYGAVWRTDHDYVSAAFGLARACCALGHRATAIDVLSGVPSRSAYRTAAQIGILIAARPALDPDGERPWDFLRTAEKLDPQHPEHLELDDLRRQQAVVTVLQDALTWHRRGRPWRPREDPVDRPPPHPPKRLLGVELTERGLRAGVEAGYRQLARHEALTEEQRCYCVNRANEIRNWSRS